MQKSAGKNLIGYLQVWNLCLSLQLKSREKYLEKDILRYWCGSSVG